MSQDDAKKDDAKQQGRRKAPGKSQGKAPPARKPGEPSRVHKDRLPRAEGPSEPPQEPPASQGRTTVELPQHWRSWLVIGLGVFILLGFVAVNLGGGSSGPSNAAAPGPVPEEPEPPLIPTTPTTPTTPEEPPSPPPKQSPPAKVWEHEITTEINTSFNIDHFPVKNLPTGFSVSESAGPTEGLEVVAAGKQAAWTGGGTPDYKNCFNTLGSGTGSDHIPLESSGQWICVETATGRIGRLRFDGNSGYSYNFDVTVWRH
jgi:hypothetical protein